MSRCAAARLYDLFSQPHVGLILLILEKSLDIAGFVFVTLFVLGQYGLTDQQHYHFHSLAIIAIVLVILLVILDLSRKL